MGVVPGISFALAPSGAVEALECLLLLVPYHASYDVAQLDRPKSPPALKYRKPTGHFAIIGLQLSHPPHKDRAEASKRALTRLTDCLDTTEAAAARSVSS